MINREMQKLGEERSVIRELFEYGKRRSEEIGREHVFDFSIGNPNLPAPDCVQEAIQTLLAETPAVELHGYTSAPGDAGVRNAVASFISGEFGVPMSADLIYMTCGASASLTTTINALCERDDEFIVLAPYFPEYRVFIERAGGAVKVVPTDARFHLDIGAIKKAVTPHTKAIVVNSPNNPTGVVYSEAELGELAALLKERSESYCSPIFLIADEPYRELTYGKKVPCILGLYDNAVVCYSFSKSLSLAGERIGYIAVSPKCRNAPAVFAAVCGAGRSLGFVCAPSLFQRVCARCLGKVADVSKYRENRDLLANELRRLGFTFIEPDGAFYLFMKTPEPDAKAFCERAKRYELLLVPSDSFGTSGYVRISYCVAKETIARSLPAFGLLAKEYGLSK